MASFRWAAAGYGWVARDFMAPAIAAAGHTLVAAADVAAPARDAARQAGLSAYDDVAAMLRAERPDALYVATPNHLHLPPVRAAAAAGIAVLCEKPMASTRNDAETIAAIVQRAGIVYGTAFDQRHHPAHVAIRRIIVENTLGTITAIRILYACWVGPSFSPGAAGCAPNWRADPEQAGGGAVMDLALHGLNLIEFLLDEPLDSLHSRLQRRVHSYAVEDGGMLTASTKSGVLISQHVAYNTPETLPHRRLEVVGTLGQMTATDTMGQSAGGTLTLIEAASGRAQDIAFDRKTSPFTRQALAFAAAVQGAPHDFSIARDLALQCRLHTAYAGARACP